MSTQKFAAGTVGLSWTSIMGSELNSLTSNWSNIASSSLTNGTNLDMFCDISIALGSITPTGQPYVGVFLYPLNGDGSIYGDNAVTAAVNATPGSTYWVGNINVKAAVGQQYGTIRGVLMPPGTWKPVVQNVTGVAFATNNNTMWYRTYNYAIV